MVLRLLARPGLLRLSATVYTTGTPAEVVGKIKYDWPLECGSIKIRNPVSTTTSYTISHMAYSGRWAMHTADSAHAPLATAYKPKWYSNNVLIRYGDSALLLAETPRYSGSYMLARVAANVDETTLPRHAAHGDRIGSLTPKSWFRCSYKLHAADGVAAEVLVFAYWLVMLINLRS